MEKVTIAITLLLFLLFTETENSVSKNSSSTNNLKNYNETIIGDWGIGRAMTYPCQCADGECGCCSGYFLSNFNINFRNRACANITYFPEDFEFHIRLIFNNHVFYQRRLSGKNPAPLCASLPRLSSLKMCIVFNNVYIISRNIHMCITMEGKFQENSLFAYNFDCIRVGANGFAILKPEAGGGLGPPMPVSENVTNEEDYDAVVASEGDEIQIGKSVILF